MSDKKQPAPLDEIETLEPTRPAPTEPSAQRPWLTVLHHPEPDRVGDWCDPFAGGGDRIPLSRLEPVFRRDQDEEAAPLGTPFLSRNPHWLSPAPGGGVRLVVESRASALRVQGEPLTLTRSFSPEELERGVVLELSERVVLLLHLRPGAPRPSRSAGEMIGRSPAMETLRTAIAHLAAGDAPVLIRGESGVGKELTARALHRASDRADRPLVCVNIAAIPGSTAASELFGHVPGAFTGATRAHRGYFEQAATGSLLLDEIGAAPAEIQAMLLRALESGEIQPVGDGRPRRVDVRVMAATDEDLEQAMAAGRFRAPLFYRLAANSLWVPALRDRREDLGRLLTHLLREELRSSGRPDLLATPDGGDPGWLGADLVTRLAMHAWPGNVRELQNVVRHMVTHFGSSPQVPTAAIVALMEEVPQAAGAPASPANQPIRPSGGKAPADISDREVLQALREHGFEIKAAAAALGISRTSLYALMERHPSLRKAAEIPDDELRRCQRECSGRLELMAERLQVSVQALRKRLNAMDP